MCRMPLIARGHTPAESQSLDSISLFAGIDRMLHGLSQRGVALVVVSSERNFGTVSWGYARPEALRQLSPVLAVDSVADVSRLI